MSLACCETGDEVLLVEPFYTNYRAFAAMGGIELKPIVTRAEDGFHLPSREEWEKALTPRTKAVILCNPNNPTGTVYSKEELVRVAEFCRDHGLTASAISPEELARAERLVAEKFATPEWTAIVP